eukprot:gene12045-14092_t
MPVDPAMMEITGLPSLIEVALHHIHEASGWSWMIVLPLFTLAIRSALFPFAVKQRINVARMMEVRPQLDKFKEISQENRKNGISNYANSDNITRLLKEKKCHPALSYVLPLVNLPFFVSTIFAVRDMAATFPSLADGGMLWFTNLGAPDAYYILPVISSGFYLLVNELSLGNSPNLFFKAIAWVGRIMAVAIIPLSYSIPSMVYFYWIPSCIFTLFQLAVFKSPKACALLKVPYFGDVMAAPPAPEVKMAPEIKRKEVKPPDFKRRK